MLFTVFDFQYVADSDVGMDELCRIKIQDRQFSEMFYAAEIRVKDGQPYIVAETSLVENEGDTVADALEVLGHVEKLSLDLPMVFPGGGIREVGGYYVDLVGDGREFLVFYPED